MRSNTHSMHRLRAWHSSNFSLFGRPEEAAFTVDLPVGPSPNTYRVVVDSGSSNLAIVTAACSCPSAKGHYYDVESSRPVATGADSVSLAYGDGTEATGRIVVDDLRLSREERVPILVAAISKVGTKSGGFGTFSDSSRSGILGLALAVIFRRRRR